MSGKGKGTRRKGSQSSRTQQQQQAAARRSAGVPRAGRSGDSGLGRGTAPASTVPDQAAPSPVRHYLDVSAIRIQDWLGRTPDLKFRRGASVLLSEATARDAWEGRLPAGLAWNDEAGDVDGVVSLVVADATGESAGSMEGTGLARAARLIVQSMRETMPYCPIQAVAGNGETYAAAYPAMAMARRDGEFLVDSPPAPPEAILAKPCDQCRFAAATRPKVRVTGEDFDLCGECSARLAAAGRTAGRPSQAPLPERRLRKALHEAGMEVRDFSDTFAEMAGAGQRDGDDAATQLALIYADGNRIGAFLRRAAATPGGPDKSAIAPLLDQATLGALARAVMDRFAGWSEPPVLVNLAGGDDLLVSVPAIDAWLFTRTLLSAFSSLLADATSAWPDVTRKDIPTLAAGLVFHHVKAPFSDVVRLAGEHLLLAKKATSGRQAAVAFLDLTADGSQPPAGRHPVTLGYLDKHAKRLQQTADLPNSRRQTLLDLHRRRQTDDFIRRLTDFDNRPLWEIAAGPGADATACHDQLTKTSNTDDVRRALDIARHWHAEPRTENDDSTASEEAR